MESIYDAYVLPIENWLSCLGGDDLSQLRTTLANVLIRNVSVTQS